MLYEDGDYYWVLPKETDEWEVARCEKTRKMGFLTKSFQFVCALSGILTHENCARIIKIERPVGDEGAA